MKKHIITIFVILISFSAFAQKDKMKQREKLKALKVAHITEQLDLTAKEAEGFWPVYNAHEKEIATFRSKSNNRNKFKQPIKFEEKEAKEFLKIMLENEKQKHDLEVKYVDDLLAILPATKVLNLFKAEHAFKRKMIEDFKVRRKAFRKE